MDFNMAWHLVRDQGVGGSNPLAPTIIPIKGGFSIAGVGAWRVCFKSALVEKGPRSLDPQRGPNGRERSNAVTALRDFSGLDDR